jgi:hypothetical protein
MWKNTTHVEHFPSKPVVFQAKATQKPIMLAPNRTPITWPSPQMGLAPLNASKPRRRPSGSLLGRGPNNASETVTRKRTEFALPSIYGDIMGIQWWFCKTNYLILQFHQCNKWLVGGFNQPLWKIWKSVRMIIPNIWKVIIQPCSKPPTRWDHGVPHGKTDSTWFDHKNSVDLTHQK